MRNVSGNTCYVDIARNGTLLSGISNGLCACDSTNTIPVNVEYIDNPGTTSATTYVIYFKTAGGAEHSYLNFNGIQSLFMAMEF